MLLTVIYVMLVLPCYVTALLILVLPMGAFTLLVMVFVASRCVVRVGYGVTSGWVVGACCDLWVGNRSS